MDLHVINKEVVENDVKNSKANKIKAEIKILYSANSIFEVDLIVANFNKTAITATALIVVFKANSELANINIEAIKTVAV